VRLRNLIKRRPRPDMGCSAIEEDKKILYLLFGLFSNAASTASVTQAYTGSK
jgi:hypothetical protein